MVDLSPFIRRLNAVLPQSFFCTATLSLYEGKQCIEIGFGDVRVFPRKTGWVVSFYEKRMQTVVCEGGMYKTAVKRFPISCEEFESVVGVLVAYYTPRKIGRISTINYS